MQSGLASQSAFVVRYSVCLGDDGGLVPGITFPLNVPFEIGTIEIYISQVSRAVSHGLIIEVRGYSCWKSYQPPYRGSWLPFSWRTGLVGL